jgi:hypothetical protein
LAKQSFMSAAWPSVRFRWMQRRSSIDPCCLFTLNLSRKFFTTMVRTICSMSSSWRKSSMYKSSKDDESSKKMDRSGSSTNSSTKILIKLNRTDRARTLWNRSYRGVGAIDSGGSRHGNRRGGTSSTGRRCRDSNGEAWPEVAAAADGWSRRRLQNGRGGCAGGGGISARQLLPHR